MRFLGSPDSVLINGNHAGTTKDTPMTKDAKSPFETAHKIWLAGIGAYGKAYDEAKGGYSKLNHNTSELFEDLVKRGLEIEETVRGTVAQNKYMEAATEQVEKVTETARSFSEQRKARFEQRMGRMRSMLGLSDSEADTSSVAVLNAKIDVLMEEIAALKGKSADDLKAAAETKTETASTDLIDDLRLIEGIGEKTAKSFAEAGVETFTALAGMGAKDATMLFTKLGVAARAAREEWYEQAKELAAGGAPRAKADQDLLARMKEQG